MLIQDNTQDFAVNINIHILPFHMECWAKYALHSCLCVEIESIFGSSFQEKDKFLSPILI